MSESPRALVGTNLEGNPASVRTDEEGFLVATPSEHALVHMGRLFFVSDLTTSGSAIVFRVSVGTSVLNINFSLKTGAKVTVAVIEGATITGAGTPLTVQNYNRIVGGSLNTLVFKGSTYTGGTTFRVNQSGFGTSPGTASTGQDITKIEYVFKPSTEYIVLYTPSTSTDTVTIMDMYEE